MIICKVTDYFETQVGNIHVLYFVPNDFHPKLGLKFHYLHGIVQITSMSLKSKKDYYLDNEKSLKTVWSCILHTLDKKEIKIPVNTEIILDEFF